MAKYIKTEEGYKEFAAVTDDKMDKTDPTGTGSFSMNRKAGTVIGINSHAEGERTTASGDISHAEGYQAIASGWNSHAEGNDTTASGGSSHAEGDRTTASGGRSHAEGDSTTASGEYSHAEGLLTVASREYSHAEGYHTIASGEASHAEGYLTTASGFCSHAEGYYSTTRGKYSHAEGGSTNAFSSVVTTTNPTTNDIITAWKTNKFSVAKGYYSHVEGNDSLALGEDSHAEGYHTVASGEDSHAEGYSTVASGDDSHAEGDHTTASGDDSHVQGKYNIEDTSNTYADIIGNGTSDTARSNAATVDWSGNAWFAGDVYTGSTSGTNKDEGSKKLATEEYVNSSIAAGGTDISLGLTSASVGQTIKVKAVDESGKPTEWEATHIGSNAGKLRWQKVNEITTTEQTNLITLTKDSNGVDISEYNALAIKVEFKVPADSTQTDNNGSVWVYPYAPYRAAVFRVITTVSGWKTTQRNNMLLFFGDINGMIYGGNNNGGVIANDENDKAFVEPLLFNGITLYINVGSTANHFPVGTIASVEVLSDRE